MNKDRVAGEAKEAKGKIKEEVGKATGDSNTEAEGTADRAAGKVQKGFGELKSKFRKATS